MMDNDESRLLDSLDYLVNNNNRLHGVPDASSVVRS